MTQPNSKQLFFLALLPPQDVQQQVTEIKHELEKRFHSRHALNSPPHITLFPPFRWDSSQVNQFACLEAFCQRSSDIPINLDGFGSFPPRVIYVNPLKTPELFEIHDRLQTFIAQQFGLVDVMARTRDFTPHMTIAHRDLTPEQFERAWAEFQGRSLQIDFIATHLSLLKHNGHHWDIAHEWPFTA